MITVEPGKAGMTSIKRINEKNFSHILQKERAQLSHPFSYSIQSNSARKKLYNGLMMTVMMMIKTSKKLCFITGLFKKNSSSEELVLQF